MKVLLIYPTQLFEDNKLIELVDKVHLIEDPVYFTDFKFHKLKLTYHRATMQFYKDYIKPDKYWEFHEVDYNRILKGATEVYLYDPVDKHLLDKVYRYAKKRLVHVYDTPAFMETLAELDEYRNKNTNKKNYYHDASFYRWQRKRLNVLMNGTKPIGGKWSFDKDNRNPYDEEYKENRIKTYDDKYVKEAVKYVDKHFGENFGDNDIMYYPISFDDSKSHLRSFLKHKIATFGKYQDGASRDVMFGSHSVLSPMLNIGLLTPRYVLDETLKHFDKKYIGSFEAFIRQLIGWRSFTHFIYQFHGNEMMEMNLLNHKYKIDKKWYEGATNIPVIDFMINKVRKYAYLHHIERLMYMGNFALITMTHPKEVYKWFMECFIDSYQWVMVPNVMGMSQYSLKGISMMTRPYFSSSNYITKMSDFEGNETWDALYYNFINKHEDLLAKIYATAMQVKHWKKMAEDKRKQILKTAKEYLK
jgi:deoxyribodipyrimidine photolyase-related protein